MHIVLVASIVSMPADICSAEKGQFVIADKSVSRQHMIIEVAQVPEGRAVSTQTQGCCCPFGSAETLKADHGPGYHSLSPEIDRSSPSKTSTQNSARSSMAKTSRVNDSTW